jgi:hypothetical protein
MTGLVVGKIDGTYDYGAAGIVPKIVVPIKKPKLKNNGFNSFVGHPKVSVPGLAEKLPSHGGHVMVFYSDGGKFGTYASNNNGNDTYSFS